MLAPTPSSVLDQQKHSMRRVKNRIQRVRPNRNAQTNECVPVGKFTSQQLLPSKGKCREIPMSGVAKEDDLAPEDWKIGSGHQEKEPRQRRVNELR